MKFYAGILLGLLVFSQFGASEATCGIWDPGACIVDAFTNMFTWIGEKIQAAITWVTVKMFESVTGMMQDTFSDMYKALQKAGEAITKKTESTIEEFIGVGDNSTGKDIEGHTQLILALLYTGELPVEWYLRPFDLEEEFEHLENLMQIAIVLAVVYISVTSFCLLILCGLTIAYLSLKAEMRRLDLLEDDQREKLEQLEKEGKSEAEQNAQQAAQNERDFMMILGCGGSQLAQQQFRGKAGRDKAADKKDGGKKGKAKPKGKAKTKGKK